MDAPLGIRRGHSNMKLILAAFALLTTVSVASGMECAFPAGMQVQQIVDTRLTWRDSSPDSMLSMSRTPTGGIRFGGTVVGGGAVYGIVASNGVANVIGYNSEFFISLASFCRETPAFVLGRVISPIKPGQTDV
jgi:hypothetical protein